MTRKELWNLAALLGLAITFLPGCIPERTSVVPAPESETQVAVIRSHPIDLVLIPGDRRMTVQWKVDGREVISGFDIFISEHDVFGFDSLEARSRVKPSNEQTYPGDTNPDDGVVEFPAENLYNGIRYFVWVRIVRADGTLSEATEIRSTACGPKGEFRLGLRFHSNTDGFSLVKNSSTRADASDNDLYFYQKDGVNYLASPSLLNGYLRATKFRSSSPGDEASDTFHDDRLDPLEAKIPVNTGDWVWLVTAEGFNAKVKVREINSGEMLLYYSLCPLAGAEYF